MKRLRGEPGSVTIWNLITGKMTTKIGSAKLPVRRVTAVGNEKKIATLKKDGTFDFFRLRFDGTTDTLFTQVTEFSDFAWTLLNDDDMSVRTHAIALLEKFFHPEKDIEMILRDNFAQNPQLVESGEIL